MPQLHRQDPSTTDQPRRGFRCLKGRRRRCRRHRHLDGRRRGGPRDATPHPVRQPDRQCSGCGRAGGTPGPEAALCSTGGQLRQLLAGRLRTATAGMYRPGCPPRQGNMPPARSASSSQPQSLPAATPLRRPWLLLPLPAWLQPAVVFVASTTGQGEPPSNLHKLWRFLLRKSLPADSLSGVAVAVFGLGDSGCAGCCGACMCCTAGARGAAGPARAASRASS